LYKTNGKKSCDLSVFMHGIHRSCFVAATTSVAEVLVKTGGLMLVFGMMVGVPVQPTDPRGVGARIPAARILSRILWDQNWGAPAFLFLRKFLPEVGWLVGWCRGRAG
jgi:hypothetical protein